MSSGKVKSNNIFTTSATRVKSAVNKYKKEFKDKYGYDVELSKLTTSEKNNFYKNLEKDLGSEFVSLFKSGLDVDEINQELSVASSDNIFSEYIEANSKTETTNSKEEFMALFDKNNNGKIDEDESLMMLDSLTAAYDVYEAENYDMDSYNTSSSSTTAGISSASSSASSLNNSSSSTSTSQTQDVKSLSTAKLNEYKELKEAEIEAMKSDYSKFQGENNKAKDNFQTVTTAQNALVSEKQNDLKDAKTTYQDAINGDTSIQQELKDSVNQNLEDIIEAQTRQSDMLNAKNEAISAKNDAQIGFSNAQAAVSEAQSTLTSLQGTLSGLQSALATYANSKDESGNPVDTSGIQGQIAAIQEQISSANMALNDAKRAEEDSKKALDTASEKLTQAENDYQEATSTLDDLNQTKNQLANEVQKTCSNETKQALYTFNQVQNELDNLKQQQKEALDVAVKNIETTQANMLDAQKKQIDAQNEVANATAELNRREAKNENKNKANQELFTDETGSNFSWHDEKESYALVVPDGLDPNDSNIPILFIGPGTGETNMWGMENGVYKDYLMQMYDNGKGFNGIIVISDINQSRAGEQVVNIVSEIKETYPNANSENMAYLGYSLGSNKLPDVVLAPELSQGSECHFASAVAVDGGRYWTEEDYRGLEEQGIRTIGVIGCQRDEMLATGLDCIYVGGSHSLVDKATFNITNQGDDKSALIQWMYDFDFELDIDKEILKNDKYK